MREMYPKERFKHLIAEQSFDGWVENDGEDANWDHKAQLLEETSAMKVVSQAQEEFHKIIDEIEFNSEPEDKIDELYAKMVLKRLSDFESRWFGKLQIVVSDESEKKATQ